MNKFLLQLYLKAENYHCIIILSNSLQWSNQKDTEKGWQIFPSTRIWHMIPVSHQTKALQKALMFSPLCSFKIQTYCRTRSAFMHNFISISRYMRHEDSTLRNLSLRKLNIRLLLSIITKHWKEPKTQHQGGIHNL